MWHMSTSTISVVIGAFGLIRKGSDRFIGGIFGRPCHKEMRKNISSQVQSPHYEMIYLCKMSGIIFFFCILKNFLTKMLSGK